MRNTWISQEDGSQKTLICKFCEKFDGIRTTATALEGQWAGGDEDIDPKWVPVCDKHRAEWHVNHGYMDGHGDEEWHEPIPAESRLPTVLLGDPNGDGFFGRDATAFMERFTKGEYDRMAAGAPEGVQVQAWEDLDPNERRALKQELLPLVTTVLRLYEES